MLLQRADSLHERALKIGADTHHLAGGLHLGAQGTLCAYELVKGQARHLDHTVVQHRLKAGVGLLGNRILNLVQGIAKAILAATLAMGYPVALEARAEERLTRGFTSITQYSKLSGCRAYCTLQPPVIPNSLIIFKAEVRSIWYSLSPSVWEGATTMLSPVCTPTGSMFSCCRP